MDNKKMKSLGNERAIIKQKKKAIKKETNAIQNKKNNNKINIYNNKHLDNYKHRKNIKKLFFLYFYFIFFIQSFFRKYNSSKIELTISGPGISKIFYNKGLTEFPPTNYPTEVYINNIRQDNVYSEYDFDYPENNVTLVYNQVNNMDCMFDSCSNITRIDFTNFDSSEVTMMTSTIKIVYL